MTRRRAPRRAGLALRKAMSAAAPRTRLAAVQAVWGQAVGAQLAGSATPVAERAGEVVVSCADPVWAAELDLMQEELLARLREQLGEEAPTALRFRVDGE